ncbi:MAG: FtsW/RodA/SpoVE family cell cycle protein [Anaerolineae bacterium]|nr:FtsW/RodA/SpoVE family cell cycle protein [Anaerolineae bacterium]
MNAATLRTAPVPTLTSRQCEATQRARRRERLLLSIAGVFIFCAALSLSLVRESNFTALWYAGVWLLCAVGVHSILNRWLPRRDPFLLPLALLLTGWGILQIERVAPNFAARQSTWLVIACLALVAVTRLPTSLRWLSHYRYLWLFIGLTLLLLTVFFGSNPSGGGPRLWLGLFDIYFQPSELLKLLLVAFFASYLADHRALLDAPTHSRLNITLRFLAPLLLMWLACVAILLWQRDLGTAALFFITFVTLLYLATGNLVYVFGGAALIAAAGVLAYFVVDLVRLRVDIWLDPWRDPQGSAFQIVRSLMAFAAGGVLGQGIGQGAPSYVPVVHSDFIFAAIGEEWGMLGGLAVIASFAVIGLRGYRLAMQVQNRVFRAYLAAGLSVVLTAQSLMIMSGVLRVIPLTGVTLPFMSYGGSSLLVSFVMIGLLLVISADT